MKDFISIFVQPWVDLLADLFNGVLFPVLVDVFQFLVSIIFTILSTLFSALIYQVLNLALKFLDALQILVDFAIGARAITIDGEKASLLWHIMNINGASKLLIGIMGMSLLLTVIFAVKKFFPLLSNREEKEPISALVRSVGLAVGRIFTVTILCTLLLNGSVQLLNLTEKYIQTSTNLADVMFYTVMEPCAKSNTSQERQKEYLMGTRDWRNQSQVKSDYDIEKTENLLTLLFAIITVVTAIGIMIGMVFNSLRRLFQLLTLYASGPVFASWSTLDGDRKYTQWRDMFVTTFFAAYTPLLAMRVYCVISAYLASHSIQYVSSSLMNTVLKSMIMIGFMYANNKSIDLLPRVMGESGAVAAGSMAGAHMLGAVAAMGALGLAKDAVTGLGKNVFSAFSDDDDTDKDSNEQDENDALESRKSRESNTARRERKSENTDNENKAAWDRSGSTSVNARKDDGGAFLGEGSRRMDGAGSGMSGRLDGNLYGDGWDEEDPNMLVDEMDDPDFADNLGSGDGMDDANEMAGNFAEADDYERTLMDAMGNGEYYLDGAPSGAVAHRAGKYSANSQIRKEAPRSVQGQQNSSNLIASMNLVGGAGISSRGETERTAIENWTTDTRGLVERVNEGMDEVIEAVDSEKDSGFGKSEEDEDGEDGD